MVSYVTFPVAWTGGTCGSARGYGACHSFGCAECRQANETGCKKEEEVKKWIKVLFWGAVCLAAVYVLFAVVMIWHLPKKIALEESRIPGIESAIAEIAGDQLLLSKRINEIVDKANGERRKKVDIVHSMLSDADVNRLALNYLGRDFSTYKSAFASEVKHARDLLKTQRDTYIKETEKADDLKRKLRVLESRKKFLCEEFSGQNRSRRNESWYRKMDDVDSQIHQLREVDLARDIKNLNSKDAFTTAQALLEKHLFALARDYEQKTIVLLEKVIAERKISFQNDEQRILLLRDRYDALNVWPLPDMRRFFFRED